ncbi:MAG: hypothetical protein WCQ49_02220 [Candidatus Saccharibacteria bacterium]
MNVCPKSLIDLARSKVDELYILEIDSTNDYDTALSILKQFVDSINFSILMTYPHETGEYLFSKVLNLATSLIQAIDLLQYITGDIKIDRLIDNRSEVITKIEKICEEMVEPASTIELAEEIYKEIKSILNGKYSQFSIKFLRNLERAYLDEAKRIDISKVELKQLYERAMASSISERIIKVIVQEIYNKI